MSYKKIHIKLYLQRPRTYFKIKYNCTRINICKYMLATHNVFINQLSPRRCNDPLIVCIIKTRLAYSQMYAPRLSYRWPMSWTWALLQKKTHHIGAITCNWFGVIVKMHLAANDLFCQIAFELTSCLSVEV